ncbi:MAG TPA: hypothetical protein VL307_19570 [Chitinophagaceae bacterium]|nr:hypothetical protein [Chitinophagaceae bacterium]
MSNHIKGNSDVKDSKRDEARMQPETVIMDMPEVKDIPGQENVVPPQFKEMQDVTISSADEEGEGILDDLNSEEEDEDETSDDATVTPLEKSLLKKSASFVPNAERDDLEKMSLDTRDADGELLNEKSFAEDRMGGDLDVPGADLDDEDEDLGEEDEENNLYSQSQRD